jgi:hypothetical protein
MKEFFVALVHPHYNYFVMCSSLGLYRRYECTYDHHPQYMHVGFYDKEVEISNLDRPEVIASELMLLDFQGIFGREFLWGALRSSDKFSALVGSRMNRGDA